ncbi:hypothetical protein FGADI_9130 [Fusarium gaditjirri]|uniref:Protein kinase domain-containing protein n=1 Tax=Fusarium gaditjirri TaxID=282569 RepID=A0A8H4WT78_9HYPO|nr:hypothetical protein FGADI_9130 [Fusarium gaditjirri]
MVTIENDSILADFVSYQTNSPHPRHIRSEDGRVTYLSQGDFGPLRDSRLLPELADFNLSYPGLEKELGHLSAIQSHRFRAPEVLLGCPWSYSADIWNLGLLMWNLLEDISLFDRPAGKDGEYDAHVHLAQMVSLLGDPPEELIKRERIYHQNFRSDLLGGGKALGDTVTGLNGDEKHTFLDFASSMLQWLPEKRKTAKELLQHPFFDPLCKDRAGCK